MLVAAAGCSSSRVAAPSIPVSGSSTLRQPDVVQRGKGGSWVQFVPKTRGTIYNAIVSGPNGGVWFLDEDAVSLASISENGAITKEYRLTGASGSIRAMAVGADKKFYILDDSTHIVRATTSGTVTIIPFPSGDQTLDFDGIALGPDGNVWFTEYGRIGKIAPSGTITEYPYPAGYTANSGGITVGADGNMWFAESSGNAIGRVVPSSGQITMFPLPTSCAPATVVQGNDGNVWFFCIEFAPMIGSITPDGAIAMYPIGGTFNDNRTGQFCARGPDGEPWCASRRDGDVIRVDTSAHTVAMYTPPLSAGTFLNALTAGPDGNLWVDTVGGTPDIDVLVFNPITVKPNALSFSAVGQRSTLTVSQTGSTHWTAASSNPTVATVAQGGTNATFAVQATGIGTCKITISDGAGNSVAVKVTVT